MESADLRDGDDRATWRGFDDSWLGTVVVKRLVWSRGVVVDAIGAQESAKMGLAQNEEMIEALAANGADDPLDKGVLPRRSGGRDHLPDPHGVNARGEGLAVDRVAITK